MGKKSLVSILILLVLYFACIVALHGWVVGIITTAIVAIVTTIVAAGSLF